MDHDTRAALTYDANKKSLLVAYLLWWFLGWAGGHRFYLGSIAGGVMMLILFVVSLLLTLVLIGYLGLMAWWVWWVVDAFLLPGMASQSNMRLINSLR